MVPLKATETLHFAFLSENVHKINLANLRKHFSGKEGWVELYNN